MPSQTEPARDSLAVSCPSCPLAGSGCEQRAKEELWRGAGWKRGAPTAGSGDPPTSPTYHGTGRGSDSGCHVGGGESCPPAWITGALPVKTDDVLSDLLLLPQQLVRSRTNKRGPSAPQVSTPACGLRPGGGQASSVVRGCRPRARPSSSTGGDSSLRLVPLPVAGTLFPRPGCQRAAQAVLTSGAWKQRVTGP